MEIRSVPGVLQWLPRLQGSGEGAREQVAVQAAPAGAVADGVEMQADGEMKEALVRLQQLVQAQLGAVEELPPQVRQAVEDILRRYAQAREVVPEGIGALLRSPRQAAELLGRLAASLEEGAQLQHAGGAAVKELLGRLAAAFEESLGTAPGEAAAKLAALLRDINGRQSALDKELAQLLQQVGGKMLAGSTGAPPEGQKRLLLQLVQAFQSQLPPELARPSMQGNLSAGRDLWALLKAVESGAASGMNRQECKAAGGVFRQLAAWLGASGAGETPDLGELFGLVQFLPTRAQQAVWSLARQQQLPASLRQWAAQLTEAAPDAADGVAELAPLERRLGGGEASRLAGLLREAADWLEGGSSRSLTAMGRMARLLPPEVARLVQQVLAREGAAEGLRNMGDFFSRLAAEPEPSELLLFLRQAGAQAPPGAADGAPAQRLLSLVSQLAARQGQAEDELGQLVRQWTARLEGDASREVLLERAVRQFGGQVPPEVAQTALRSELPQLPRLWVLFKALEAGQWRELPPAAQEKAAETVRQLAQALQRPVVWEAETAPKHSLLTFTSTLLAQPQGPPQAMYWHVYHQLQEDAQGRPTGEFETWLRVCLETEHLGLVEAVFRHYDGQALDVRLRFEGEAGAAAFRDLLPEVRQSVGRLPLALGDIWVGDKSRKKE